MNDVIRNRHPGALAAARNIGAQEHWSTFAERWASIGSPGRPHAEDVVQYEACVAACAASEETGPALLLGVTPEIATMRWPDGSSFVAVDSSREVVQGLWEQARVRVSALALVGQWQRLPFRNGSVSLAIGDGCLTALGPSATQASVFRELVRVLRPGAQLIMRLFAKPVPAESVESVFEDLSAGRIGSFDAFKWRLLMATPADDEDAVLLADAFNLWAHAAIDRARLAEATGWPRAAIDTIDSYRDNNARLAFPPFAKAIDGLAPFFRVVGTFTQRYELAERCPIIVASLRDDIPG